MGGGGVEEEKGGIICERTEGLEKGDGMLVKCSSPSILQVGICDYYFYAYQVAAEMHFLCFLVVYKLMSSALM